MWQREKRKLRDMEIPVVENVQDRKNHEEKGKANFGADSTDPLAAVIVGEPSSSR